MVDQANLPAFPNPALADEHWCGFDGAEGMSLRDWFAGQALAGAIGERHPNGGSESSQTPREIARDAYRIADAMLRFRQEKTP